MPDPIGSFRRVRVGDVATARELDRDLDRVTSPHEYSVAPGCSVRTATGERGEGEEITERDLGEGVQARSRLQRLLDHRAVLHRPQARKGARYVVGERSIVTRLGVLEPGAEVVPGEHLEAQDIASCVRRGLVVDRGEQREQAQAKGAARRRDSGEGPAAA